MRTTRARDAKSRSKGRRDEQEKLGFGDLLITKDRSVISSLFSRDKNRIEQSWDLASHILNFKTKHKASSSSLFVRAQTRVSIDAPNPAIQAHDILMLELLHSITSFSPHPSELIPPSYFTLCGIYPPFVYSNLLLHMFFSSPPSASSYASYAWVLDYVAFPPVSNAVDFEASALITPKAVRFSILY